MILKELLPSVHALPRADKLRLIQLLAADVASEDGLTASDVDTTYPVWSPHEAFNGAATLLRVLEQEQVKSEGVDFKSLKLGNQTLDGVVIELQRIYGLDSMTS